MSKVNTSVKTAELVIVTAVVMKKLMNDRISAVIKSAPQKEQVPTLTKTTFDDIKGFASADANVETAAKTLLTLLPELKDYNEDIFNEIKTMRLGFLGMGDPAQRADI